uniref:Stage 0 sporulation protein A homolog n=1 Tax=uncultured prokaryote TaxID=198431 RepID=A0A0H5Q1Z9_9ZZZZ|nr:hypothetical protein [uncultured prokaryote]
MQAKKKKLCNCGVLCYNRNRNGSLEEKMMNTVAIVEDDRLFNEALYQILKKAGYETARAYSYGEGLALIEKTPDLMIVDVNLPGGEGFELCRRARDYGQIPVIFLTARDEETDMIKAFDLGADDYLVKPFPMAVLLKHVEAVLRRSSSEKDVLSYMDLQIDFQRKSVSYQGAEIKLTAREYGVLALLAKNQGRIVTKEMILEQVWDAEGAFVEENTVNVTLSRLRKKIEPEPASPIFIRNVFGMGYTFGK